ncbi:MAG: NAD(P)-dependent oxidoreductase, partial [Acetobacteraceae bacterium]
MVEAEVLLELPMRLLARALIGERRDKDQPTSEIGVMPEPELLLIEPMMPEIEASLDRIYRVHRVFSATSRMAATKANTERVRGVVTGGGSGLARELMDALPGLEIIAINGIGTDQVDLAEARTRGIRVTTTPDVLTDDVADMAIGLLIATMRGLCGGHGFVRAGGWGRSEPPPLARRVSGKRAGILGFGRVGQAIARRAQAFGMDIAYTDLRTVPDAPFRHEPD